MSTISRTYTFTDGTTAYGSQVETEFSTIVNAWNNHDAGTSAWTKVKISSSETTPLDIISSGATTQVSIDNTATNGDPLITFKLSGTAVWSIGVDDSDSDSLCITAAGTMNGTNYLKVSSSAITFGVTDVGVTRTSVGGSVILYAENADNSNTSSHAVILAQVAGTGSGDPYIRWNITGGSPSDWVMGADNSAGDIFTLSRGTAIGTNNVFSVNASSIFSFTNAPLIPDGSSSSPGIAFSSDADAGIWWGSTTLSIGLNGASGDRIALSNTNIDFIAAGTSRVQISTTIFPTTDNSISCGKTGNRWSEVWAANGTIQTSHSDFKYDIVEIKDPIIPKGVYYRWKDKKGTDNDRTWIGFIADPLPKEAFAWQENGEIDKTGIKLDSVVGELCAGYWKHEQRIEDLKKQIAELKLSA